MGKKSSHITVTDQFCGAGGSSQGVRALSKKLGGGIEVKLALNHWRLAIETHNTNFPDTEHDCADMSGVDPRRYRSTDFLITSPSCTYQSAASGRDVPKKQIDLFLQGQIDEEAERSRATMWDVPRFAEYHKYNVIVVENVVEARKWVPYESWLHAMDSLGYNHRACYLNSMHFHPTPQSRDRMYVVFWRKGNKAPNLDYHPISYCHTCSKDVPAVQTWKNSSVRFGKYRQQYVYCCPFCAKVIEPYYYASFNAIDWTDLGTKISERPKELSPNTIIRAKHGLKKYGSQPFQVVNYTPGYSKSIFDGFGSITTQDHHGICSPYIIKLEHSQRVDNHKPVSDPLMTQTTRQSQMLITPFITISRGRSLTADIIDPLNTVSAGGIHSGLVTTEAWGSFLASNYSTGHCVKHISQEMGALSTTDRHGLFNFQTPDIEDCYYRMLKAPEVQLGMGFEKGYVVLGNSRQKVKQCGNAVTPPVMEWLIGQGIESLN